MKIANGQEAKTLVIDYSNTAVATTTHINASIKRHASDLNQRQPGEAVHVTALRLRDTKKKRIYQEQVEADGKIFMSFATSPVGTFSADALAVLEGLIDSSPFSVTRPQVYDAFKRRIIRSSAVALNNAERRSGIFFAKGSASSKEWFDTFENHAASEDPTAPLNQIRPSRSPSTDPTTPDIGVPFEQMDPTHEGNIPESIRRSTSTSTSSSPLPSASTSNPVVSQTSTKTNGVTTNLSANNSNGNRSSRDREREAEGKHNTTQH